MELISQVGLHPSLRFSFHRISKVSPKNTKQIAGVFENVRDIKIEQSKL